MARKAAPLEARVAPADAVVTRVAAIVPAHREPPAGRLVTELRTVVDDVLLVDDGMPPDRAAELARLAAETDSGLLRLPRNLGKGHAIAAARRLLLSLDPPPDAVAVVDADGQHPVGALPALLAAPSELVVGDRSGDWRAMPWERRVMNRLSSRILGAVTHRRVPDSQCGMRVLRGRALHGIDFPGGGYESETRHLKRCLLAGVDVAWVPIPAVYSGQPSSFRPVRDSARVLGALLV